MKTNLAGVSVGKNAPTRIMGVINVSPESFYKGSVQTRKKALLQTAKRMVQEGADFIDVGAMSTAPYLKTALPEREEARRLTEAVKVLSKTIRVPISIDTARSGPAAAGLKAGAKIINDVHGLQKDPALAAVAKKAQGLILMAHPYKYKEVQFQDPVRSTRRIFKDIWRHVKQHRLSAKNIVLDPGIGFFRHTKIPWWQWDLSIIQKLNKLAPQETPLLVGISRKSFIGHLMNGAPPEDRLPGSIAATLMAVSRGAAVIRTHDVKATRDALMTFAAFQNN